MAREIPLLYGSPKDRALFGPEDFLGWYSKNEKSKARKLKTLLLFFGHGTYSAARKAFKAKKTTTHDIKRLHASKAKINGKEVGLICFQGIGASNVVAFCEEFIALGTKNIILAGAAGGLQKKDYPGKFVLPIKAIRDEGTSYHYLKPGKYAFPDRQSAAAIEKALKKHGLDYAKGSTWTTDAPYRETIRKLQKYRKEGVLTVEMEASAVFALANYRKIRAAGLFYVSDLLTEKKWKPHFGSKELKKAKGRLAKVLLETVKGLR